MSTVRTSLTSSAEVAPPKYMDPAEVFALVASRLRQDPPQRLEMSRWRASSTIKDRTARLAEAITAAGVVTDKQLARCTSRRSAFTLLCAIDRAFATLDPYFGSRHHGRLGRFREVLRKEGRYNQSLNPDHGAVIPRRSFPTRPQHVPDHEAEHFHSLMLVPQRPEHVHFKRIEAEFDFPDLVRTNPDIVIGCVAFIGDLSELNFRRIDDDDAWYSIEARTDDEQSTSIWKDRIEQTIIEFDASGAHIGVLPELALTDQILELWRSALLRIKRPPHSSLHWILVGTGPITLDPRLDQQPNRAVLLHRETAKEVMFQDKCEPFTIDDDQIRNWQLPAHLAPGPLAEWMREGRERYVIDTNVGRLAILVCEDHGRLMTVGAELATVAPTHLLIPIFAPPILRYRWQEKAAQEFANTTGSASVVVTSCAVDFPIGEPTPKKGQYGTALIIKPGEAGPSYRWSAKTQIKDAERDPTRVLKFLMPRS